MTSRHSERDERVSYRVSGDPKQVAEERKRLEHLTGRSDRSTCAVIERLGIQEGWRCLEVGAGSGTVAHWLGERVGPSGRVLSVDVDIRFHVPVPEHVEVRRLDVTSEPLGRDVFDLVHARAVLEHLHQREEVLDRMLEALRPGGWIFLEDGDWTGFDAQVLPEDFGALHRRSLQNAVGTTGFDPACGRWLLGALRARGVVECDARGTVYVMRGGTPSAEWYVAGLARTCEHYLKDGTFTQEAIERALAQARAPEFQILSPVSMQAWGRKRA